MNRKKCQGKKSGDVPHSRFDFSARELLKLQLEAQKLAQLSKRNFWQIIVGTDNFAETRIPSLGDRAFDARHF